MNDSFRDGGDPKVKNIRIDLLKNGLEFDPEKYEYKEDFVPADPSKPLEAHTTHEMIECMKRDPKIQLEAQVLGTNGESRGVRKMNREQFMEAVKRKDSKRFRESIDDFSSNSNFDQEIIGGQDFTPLLGGPFNKQLYYRDYLRMIAASFYAYNHDPAARAVVSIMIDFTLGRGFQLHTDNQAAQILWNAFVEANDFHRQMDYCAAETSIYGENMWWWLPDHNARISYQPVKGEKVPKAVIPRIRLIDPSNIAEIITIPEDMVQGVLYYVWLAPTQYQMYTRDNQPTTKFIYTQIPADQILHEKINSVSNEKRGRSDYFPALGYMKRLRDGVNYGLVAQQKAAAWCIDTTIAGDESDFNTYMQQQQALGDVPTAGSEFVHTEAVKREYLSNSATSKGADSPVFQWCLSMIAMSSGIPISYLGTHLHAAGGSRASALVSTEPVVKRFERRQLVYERTIRKIFNGLMQRFGMEAECDILFPELITQDRSSKLKDLMLSQNQSWISHRRAAEIAAKELDAKNFDYEMEMADIKEDDAALGIDPASMGAPLTKPGNVSQDSDSDKQSMDGAEKKQVKDNLGTL